LDLKITREFPVKQPYSHLYGDDVGREDEPRSALPSSTLVVRIRKLNAVGHSSLFETWRITIEKLQSPRESISIRECESILASNDVCNSITNLGEIVTLSA